MNFEQKDLVRVARRENNTKRPYLLVNPLQGKHVPVPPHKALRVFDALGASVCEVVGDAPALVIAFAETATAIGAALAARLSGEVWLMQTTRESVPDTDFLYFSETHSHATEQRLATRGLAEVLARVRYVIFAEDEVTTGNTIRHLMDVLCQQYTVPHVTFGIASLLNGMTDAAREQFVQQGIWTRFLLQTDNRALEQTMRHYAGDGLRHSVQRQAVEDTQIVPVPGKQDMRLVCRAQTYQTAIDDLIQVARHTLLERAQNILVLGTEECMYPGLLVGRALEQDGYTVHFHATTRSPILPSREPDYPLHTRYELRSLYDPERITYLYNLAAYDQVYVVTDAQHPKHGLQTLQAALAQAGNTQVKVLEWRNA